MKPETKFKIKIRPILDAIPYSYWEKTQQVSIRGTPDFIGCIGGKAIVLELKVGDNDTDALQSYKLHRWALAGAKAFVVTPENFNEVLGVLNEFVIQEENSHASINTSSNRRKSKRASVPR